MAKCIKMYKNDDLFTATPPLEAKNMLMYTVLGLFKTFEGGEGKFFNPYALENRQIERQKSPNNSQQDIRLEDDDV